MSPENDRPRYVIWVPDLASETGWSGVQVRGDETKREERRSREIGFRVEKKPERE